MENTENTVNSTETVVEAELTETEDGGETVLFSEAEAEADGDDTDDGAFDEEAELSELRRISGVEYGSLSDFSGYQRYLELKKSGILTAEEAFYAVNRKKKQGTMPDGAVANGSKHHMTASRRKPSSGEVFTRADREELAKWGISATGSELERLWRGAGK